MVWGVTVWIETSIVQKIPDCNFQAFTISLRWTICAYMTVCTDHGVSHEETGDVRVLLLHPLHMLDHILHICIKGLHVHTLTLTPAMANWRRKVQTTSNNSHSISNLLITRVIKRKFALNGNFSTQDFSDEGTNYSIFINSSSPQNHSQLKEAVQHADFPTQHAQIWMWGIS